MHWASDDLLSKKKMEVAEIWCLMNIDVAGVNDNDDNKMEDAYDIVGISDVAQQDDTVLVVCLYCETGVLVVLGDDSLCSIAGVD